uniref:Uncharacterized protein n=1 Tax=Melanopsichium pennsylvanicum 4 TaxID=1398559 RepID=A0A077REJ9_9BASI|nr:uncharacterized protein BN887_03347 [Melanopsichium pennsylvanicum 4]
MASGDRGFVADLVANWIAQFAGKSGAAAVN